MFLTSSVLADLYLLGIFALFVFHVWWLKRLGRWNIFDPLNFLWAGAFVIYVIEALSNYDVYILWYGQATFEDALLWTLFGLIVLHIGYHIRLGRRLTAYLPDLPQRLARKQFFWLSIVLVLLGALGWGLLIGSSGGISSWASVGRGNVDWEVTSGYLGAMAEFLYIGAFLLLVYVRVNKTTLMAQILVWALLAFILVFVLYLGSRSRTILVVLVAFMAWGLSRKRTPSLVMAVPIFAGLLVVVNFQAQYREQFTDLSFNLSEINWEDVPGEVLPRFLLGQDAQPRISGGSELSVTSVVVQLVPERVPYALGQEFLQFFTHPIPRELWPGKRYPKNEAWTPIHFLGGTSDWWVDHVEVPFLAGPAPGFTASWYYNGGPLGLVVGGILVGVLLRVIRGILDRSATNQSYFLLYILTAPIGFGEAVGHPFGFVYTLPVFLVPLVSILYFSKRLVDSGNRFASSAVVRN